MHSHDYVNAKGIFSIYGVYPGMDDSMEHRRFLMGRVLINDGHLMVLEAHSPLMESLRNGPVIGANDYMLNSMTHNMYMDVVSESDIKEGHRIDLIPQADFGPKMIDSHTSMPDVDKEMDFVRPPPSQEPKPEIPQPRAPVFDYIRVGMTHPQVIEIYGNDEFYMNSQKLSEAEVERIEYNVKNGLAQLRYRSGGK